MPRLIILSRVDDEGVRVDVSRAYASVSSNAQCQVGARARHHFTERRYRRILLSVLLRCVAAVLKPRRLYNI